MTIDGNEVEPVFRPVFFSISVSVWRDMCFHQEITIITVLEFVWNVTSEDVVILRDLRDMNKVNSFQEGSLLLVICVLRNERRQSMCFVKHEFHIPENGEVVVDGLSLDTYMRLSLGELYILVI